MDIGETDITREAPETVDRDRAGEAMISALTGRAIDLYGAMAGPARAAADGGETEITHAAETIDRDRPPEFPVSTRASSSAAKTIHARPQSPRLCETSTAIS
jgi:hypothetical protein